MLRLFKTPAIRSFTNTRSHAQPIWLFGRSTLEPSIPLNLMCLSSSSLMRIGNSRKSDQKFARSKSPIILAGTLGLLATDLSLSTTKKTKEIIDELPTDVKNILDAHASELQELLKHADHNARMGYNVRQKDWLPGYYIKNGIQRVKNAQKLNAVIEEYNLNLLCVPEKYVYHVPGRPDCVSDENYLVIVRKIDGNAGKGQCLNVEHVKQLCILAEAAPHYDLHPANYVLRKDGTLVIIDTDAHAMPSPEKIKALRQDWLEYGTRIHDGYGFNPSPEVINHPLIKLELPMYSKWPNYDDAAFAYLCKKIAQTEEERKKLLKAYKP